MSSRSLNRDDLRMRFWLMAVLLPQALAAQFWGASLGRVSATVDWQVPKPSQPCDFCVVDVAPNASRESWAPAIAVNARSEKLVGLSSEIRYTLKGYATTQPTLNIHYLETPALVRVGHLVSTHTRASPFIEAGPALALRVHCEVEYNSTGAACKKGVAFGQDWRVRSFDISGVAGIGLAIRAGSEVIVAGARVDRGMVDIGGGQGVPTKNRSNLLYVSLLSPIAHHSR